MAQITDFAALDEYTMIRVIYDDENGIRKTRYLSYTGHTEEVLMVCGAFHHSIPWDNIHSVELA